MFDVIIIGGGVAGLMAAGVAAERGRRTLLLEKMEKPARKLRITGKGRCNITNTKTREEFLAKVRKGAEFFEPAFDKLNNLQTIEFFNQIGLKTTTERGERVFPASGSAVDVAQALVRWCEEKGVEIRCHAQVENIAKADNGIFEITVNKQSLKARNVIITTGGVSYPATGSTGDGYQFAYDLSHDIVPLLPALVALRIDPQTAPTPIALKNTTAKLIVSGKQVDERFGDVDFTNRGLGGAAILQLSRDAVTSISENKEVDIVLDLKPALSLEKITARLEREKMELPQTAILKELLRKILPKELIATVTAQAELSNKKPIKTISQNNLQRVAEIVKNLSFPIIDYGSFNEAIITNGGVELSQVNPDTMESSIVEGLFFAGEVLDIDADTGGYNIQIALSTAYLAANSLQ